MIIKEKTMKKNYCSLLLTLVLTLLNLPTFSMILDDEEGLYLYTKTTNEPVVYSFDELHKITFSKKGVQMWNTNWPTEYSYANFRVLTIKSKNNTAVINSPLSNTTLHEGEGVVYYDLQGRKVSSPRQGVYIMRSTDGTTRKVLIK